MAPRNRNGKDRIILLQLRGTLHFSGGGDVMVTHRDIADKIGTSVYGQMAEECAELAQACMKADRKERGVNPTEMNLNDIIGNLEEEIADVLLCTDVLLAHLDAEYYLSSNIEHNPDIMNIIEETMTEKYERWQNRLERGV